ncbi:OsmC family peroxiredoxin [Spirosoma sp. KCTC 42546]|uniref:OsmC family protein n=1 Tax=Spirosoma sp. KCTC 42546 TaxID=2520506 RepID=UPI00115812FE|nr:OsmC family protein [Spirosoma sp. KCTC 42546]QDK81370.1 OsmC family peroxiredoxin [Spirosoma sp. KCTC 42546]
MAKQHQYALTIKWTGNTGEGTSTYRSYERSHIISVDNKPDIPGSSDPAFRGDSTKYNPEELLVASLSTCHMLSYLHLCAVAGVNVIEYTDKATGVMVETPDGGGHFSEVTLHPHVVVADSSMIDKANELHHQANKLCFIANSCNFPVHHEPTCIV